MDAEDETRILRASCSTVIGREEAPPPTLHTVLFVQLYELAGCRYFPTLSVEWKLILLASELCKYFIVSI